MSIGEPITQTVMIIVVLGYLSCVCHNFFRGVASIILLFYWQQTTVTWILLPSDRANWVAISLSQLPWKIIWHTLVLVFTTLDHLFAIAEENASFAWPPTKCKIHTHTHTHTHTHKFIVRKNPDGLCDPKYVTICGWISLFLAFAQIN